MLMHRTYTDCTDAYFTPLTKLKTALNPVLAIQINLELAGEERSIKLTRQRIASSDQNVSCPEYVNIRGGAESELLLY